MGRNAPPSELRYALCVGVLIAMVLLAGLGLQEYLSRRANALILISVALEVFIALGFIGILLR